MLGIKETLLLLLTKKAILSGSITFPYEVPFDGVLSIRIGAQNTNTGAYAYFSIDNGVVAGWSGTANGGWQNVCFGVKKGEKITMASSNIASTYARLMPVFSGGGN